METGLVYVALVSMFFIGLVLGGIIVFFFRRMAINRQLRNAQRKAARTVAEARDESKDILREAKEEIERNKAKNETELRERRSELQKQENRLSSKTETLDRRLESVEQRDRNLANKEKNIEALRNEITEVKDKQLKQLEVVSGMSSADAKQELLDRMEVETKEEISRRLREWEVKLKEESDKISQVILAQTIQRCASDVVSEISVVSVPLPGDEMKGRLIGREGRNIRALEQATGGDLIIADKTAAGNTPR